MPSTRVPQDKIAATQEAFRRLGTVAATAREINVSRSTVRARLGAGPPPRAPEPAKPVVRVKAGSAPFDISGIDLRRAEARASDLAAQLRDAQDRALRAEALVANLLGTRSAKVDPAVWAPSAPAAQRATTLLPMLFTSDMHVGEVVDAAEIDGMNTYGLDVFAERYQRMIERTANLASDHTGAAEFPGIYYLRGGDAISGGIHDELAASDALSSVPAVRHLVRQESEGIRRLKSRFGRVHVISVPGNHGRTTRKPWAKGYAERSWETLIAWWLADLFADDPAVTFETPKSADAYFDALGWKVLMSHGDRIGSRGGQGFVGPAATIARGHQKLQANYSLSGRPVDLILTGHFHTSLKLGRGFGNGAFIGYNEYARDLRATPDAAKQWLILMHEARCVSHQFEIQLSDPPRRSAQPEWR